METKGIWKLFQYSACALFKNSSISYSHVSIAGESHLWKIVPKLISVGTTRFATDEILYHAKRSYFLVPLLRGVAHVVFPPKKRKMPRCFLYRFCCRALFRSLREGSVKRARVREFARNVAKNVSSRVLSRDYKLHLYLGDDAGVRGMREQTGRDYRGFLEVLRAATAAVAAFLGYTPDILPDNGRSGSH